MPVISIRPAHANILLPRFGAIPLQKRFVIKSALPRALAFHQSPEGWVTIGVFNYFLYIRSVGGKFIAL